MTPGSSRGAVAAGAGSFRYRADIDGLRAVAVAPVVLYHAGVDAFSGGFVGVDVFFVISGFLITGILLRDFENDQFSILRFYERRVRRIFPALFVVLAVFTPLVLWFYLPTDAESFGWSLLGATFFSSNFVFWREAGYFDAPAQTKPLLHTWSLAVEEQFYILFPLFLSRFAKSREALLAGLLSVWAGSFLGSLMALEGAPSGAFYLPQSRAWELLTGALLAAVPADRLRIRPRFGPSVDRLAAELLGAVGIALILYAVFSFDELTPFPGIAALAPCLGAALVIRSGASQATWTARALSLKPVVLLGLISYSLYLWHWPALALAQYVTLGALPESTAIAIATGSVVAATISWRYVERPFRSPNALFSRRQVFALAATVMAVAAATGLAAGQTGGFPRRFANEQLARLDRALRLNRIRLRCISAGDLCQIGADGPEPSFLIWGDSHAIAVLPGIDDLARRLGATGLAGYSHMCTPLVGVHRLGDAGLCIDFNETMLSRVRDLHSVETVILVGRWAICADASVYENESTKPCALGLSGDDAPDAERTRELFVIGLANTVRGLRELGKEVVFMAQAPEVSFSVPHALTLRERLSQPPPEGPLLTDYLRRQSRSMAIFEQLRDRYGARIVYPHRTLCPDDRCRIARDGESLYLDDDHLNDLGAQAISVIFEGIIEPGRRSAAPVITADAPSQP